MPLYVIPAARPRLQRLNVPGTTGFLEQALGLPAGDVQTVLVGERRLSIEQVLVLADAVGCPWGELVEERYVH